MNKLMQNNSQKSKQRVITASILAPIVVLGILWASPALFLWASSLMLLYGAWEWATLIGFKTSTQKFSYAISVAAVFIILYLFFSPYLILWLALCWWIFAAVLIKRYPSSTHWWTRGWHWRGVMGWLVLAPCWVGMNIIRQHDLGPGWLFLAFFLVWCADSGAYIAGRLFGKHKLAPNVSPGKTWEGLVGAFIAAMIFAVIIGLIFHFHAMIDYYKLLLIAILVVIASVIGDLFESMCKRVVGVKDSGKLFPGHGGMLDRIDSLTAAIPIFALAFTLLF